MNSNTIKEGKILAILSYFTFIGLIICYVMNIEKKNEFVLFHSRQMVGFVFIAFIADFFEKSEKYVIGDTFRIIYYSCCLFGIVTALLGQTRPLPLIGKYFQKWFANIK